MTDRAKHYRVNPEGRTAQECTKCGTTHYRKAPTCAACFREYLTGYGKRTAPGSPPSPPPGFDMRDLTTGKPLL